MSTGMIGTSTLITTTTANDDSSIVFSSGIDSTYLEYVFVWTSIRPASDSQKLQVDFSSDGGSTYGIYKLTHYIQAQHNENGSSGDLSYQGSYDLAGTGSVNLNQDQGNDADQNSGGVLHLYNPTVTTRVKNFMSTCAFSVHDNRVGESWVGGFVGDYGDSAALNAVKFFFPSGNMYGTIQMYGIE